MYRHSIQEENSMSLEHIVRASTPIATTHTVSGPLVSVVIPFYNEEIFLREAIESVILQDYRNWELLLVDDGSTNSSAQIAQEYAARYPGKIIYLAHEGNQNKGVCVSRNLGVAQAKGELVALLDADDVWLPEKLSVQVALFEKNPHIGMVAEASVHWYSWEDAGRRDIPVYVGAKADTVYPPSALLHQLYPLHNGAAPGPCALMLRKSAILRVGGFEEAFVREYQLYEDQAFLCKIYLQEHVYISSACNNLYRQRRESVVKRVKENGHYHMVRQHFLEWLSRYLDNKSIEDKILHSLLEQALLPYHHPLLYFISQAPANMLKLSKRAIPGVVKQKIKRQLCL